ncbi:hypothetical protein SB751_20530 [Cupriavidus sp. SIMBA_020]|uniref:hypothetical protein n=1 Tax=Cupriavidus sp. SIMBA_020 TaxID=3085766 RepID=UPI00397980C3
MTVHPKIIDGGNGGNVSLAAVNTRLKKIQHIDQDGCYIELPDVEGSSNDNNYDRANQKVEALSVASSNGVNFKVPVKLP